MLPTGALSIVRRTYVDEEDERELVVRARRREWLDEFRGRWCPDMGASIHDGHRDYQWHAYVTRHDLGLALARIAMDLDWNNFKAATMSPKRGLADMKLRTSLHDAYSKVWGTLLGAGDGTSAYDSKGGWLTGIEACRRWGHWWPKGAETCHDCGQPNPNYPNAGPRDVFPPAAKKTRKK